MHARHRGRELAHPLARIVYESLGAVLSPQRCEEVLAAALGAAALDAIPDRPALLHAFIEGALGMSLAARLDPVDAAEICDQLHAALAFTGEAPISQVHECLAPPERVLVATHASLVVFILQDVLGDDVEVLAVSDPRQLDAALARDSRALVVVDRKHPSIDPHHMCELLARTLTGASTVVWWGAPIAEHTDVHQRLEGGPRVLTCGFDVRLADLGDLCLRLVRPT